jgi:hypothetical protein
MAKFGVPFSGAADEVIGGASMAAKGDSFPADQVDESRKGAMRGDPKYAKSVDSKMMQSTGAPCEGYAGWKKMETFE